MKCVSITPLLFLATVLLAQVTCQQSGRSTCPCLKTSKCVLRKEYIRSYTVQKAGVCHIDAIVFKTASGFTCSKPHLPWVERAMKFVDKKAAAIKTTARPIFSTSTFQTTSMLNTTSHWNTTG
ncbi:chemokine (C-X-C motif) ligand 32b, duplicate 1 [Rhinichthys klamathensis goyatoka]|uniref:chemokine (C-X-C motif) ligand 32b, duplicate 1 n=1 Tax=Rhinichthys klamathensis goyatoka TaxID=3034132 RepID=UPI0024B62303|nr:chemokine (C-X-C motif) ligand 32b, duplicate 1 [Rhinichthys klamathensis goyatoka]